jgi:tRNA pseudouridine55 synthase
LGATTPSYDLETEVDATFPADHISEEMISKTTKVFIGNIEQKPPIFSALKKDGQRLYDLARAGKTAEIKSRSVHIKEFEIVSIQMPRVKFRVVCSKGTYIRSLAHDFGLALKSGAHLSKLRRTKIGDFSVEHALEPLNFIEEKLG